jgi:hypothetical protein
LVLWFIGSLVLEPETEAFAHFLVMGREIPGKTVAVVCRGLVRHPVRHLVIQWNWKQALFVAGIRGVLFFATNLTHGLPAAVEALMTDALFRIPLAGVYPAVTQALSGAEPVWAAVAVNLAVLPVVAHFVEAAVHWWMGTPALGVSVAASVALSVLSTFFTMFAMRRGFFVVGGAARPFREDLARLPSLVADFLLAPFAQRRT